MGNTSVKANRPNRPNKSNRYRPNRSAYKRTTYKTHRYHRRHRHRYGGGPGSPLNPSATRKHDSKLKSKARKTEEPLLKLVLLEEAARNMTPTDETILVEAARKSERRKIQEAYKKKMEKRAELLKKAQAQAEAQAKQMTPKEDTTGRKKWQKPSKPVSRLATLTEDDE